MIISGQALWLQTRRIQGYRGLSVNGPDDHTALSDSTGSHARFYKVPHQHSQRAHALFVHAEGAEGAGKDVEEDGDGEVPQGRPAKGRKARQGGSCDPSATLEAFEALNVKKFDLAFAVDPLFHKTSALFDAGGARGMPACFAVRHDKHQTVLLL